MAKWSGIIGFSDTAETAPGVWTEQITERFYCGDLIRNTRRYQTADKLNDDINISNEISIVADLFANEHLCEIRYAEIYGTKWKVTGVDIQYPRLILTVGGVYNGK